MCLFCFVQIDLNIRIWILCVEKSIEFFLGVEFFSKIRFKIDLFALFYSKKKKKIEIDKRSKSLYDEFKNIFQSNNHICDSIQLDFIRTNK